MPLRTPHAMRAACLPILLALLTVAAAANAAPADAATQVAAIGTKVTLTLKNHQFTPSSFTVPAAEKVHVTLINDDAATEEFDSIDLGVEHDVTPKGKTDFDIGPLQPGEYSFIGEFHAKTAQGKVTAVATGG